MACPVKEPLISDFWETIFPTAVPNDRIPESIVLCVQECLDANKQEADKQKILLFCVRKCITKAPQHIKDQLNMPNGHALFAEE